MKTKLFIAIAILAITTLTSCEKEDALVNTETNSSSLLAKDPISSTHYKVYFDNGKQPGVEGVDYGCKGTGGNCLDTVSTHSSPSGPWIICCGGDIYVGIDSGDDGAVKSFFAQHQEALIEIFPENLVQGVINGTLTVSYKGSPLEGATVYFHFKDLEETLINVVPLLY